MIVFFEGKIFSLQFHGGVSRIFFELMRLFAKKKIVEQIFYRGLYIDRYPFDKKWFKRYYGLKNPIGRGSRFIKAFDNKVLEFAYNLNANSKLIYHATYYRFPRRPKGPVVIHVFDMIHELFSGNLDIKILKKKAINAADLIISISESTKKDICRLHQIDPQKIVVAYPGLSSIFNKRSREISAPSKRERINERPYMLYVGNRDWYKNFDLLLNTFISQKYFNDFDLILAGGSKNLSIQQKEAINKCSGKGAWLKHKFCNDRELAELYSNATVFISTSEYEGFGITLIEAMACGCPVIARNISSIPEVVGNAAILFDPKDPEDLGRKIDRIITDRSLAIDLVRQGKLQAQQFTWEAMADAVYKGYLRLI